MVRENIEMNIDKDTLLDKKYSDLKRYLSELGSVCVAFSGGVDSTFLLKCAKILLGENCIAVTNVSPAFPEEDYINIREFCAKEKIRLIQIEADELSLPEYRENGKDRCYYCKKFFFGKIKEIAKENGIQNVIEGSNVDDISDYRPGMRAIKELGIISPLMANGLTKSDIRELSKKLELPTWDKPSFACLASRIPYGVEITKEKLLMISQGERLLRELGLRQYRVRIHGDVARIEVMKDEFSIILDDKNREKILKEFKEIGFKYISLDLDGFRSGSMNEVIETS